MVSTIWVLAASYSKNVLCSKLLAGWSLCSCRGSFQVLCLPPPQSKDMHGWQIGDSKLALGRMLI